MILYARFAAAIPRAAALLALLVAAPSLAQAPAPVPEGLAEHTFSSAGTELRYVVAGKGMPLVLIHGFTANVENNWLLPGILPKLAESFQVIALDLRGHGKSAKPHDPAVYGEQMARDVLNLLDHLKIEKTFVAGYSMGGFTTMKLLTMAPERFYGAVLGGAGWLAPGEDDGFRESLATALENGEGITPLLAALAPEGEALPPEQVTMINRMLLATNDPLALAAVARSMGALAVDGAAIDRIQVPVLAVVGSKDPLRAGVQMLAARKPDVEVHIIEGADHMTAIQSPELAEAIREFVAKACACA